MSRAKLNKDYALTLILHQPAYEILEKLMEKTGASSKAEVVRRALEHYNFLMKGE